VDARDTLERLVPEQVHAEDRAGAESLRFHLERYEFAAQHARAGRLLDLACGVGYGTRLLADQRPDLTSLTGVDLSPGAIRYAKDHYASERVCFLQADAMGFGGEGESYDTIVSLETIEHLPDPEAFFARLAGLLAPGAVLVASVPTTPSVDLNPHHLHDFTSQGFRQLGSRHGLAELASLTQVQRVGLSELWSGNRRFRRGNLRDNLSGYYLSHPGALLKRVATTLRRGLANHYLTIAWAKSR
jgi:2-polyprenyl-3-methyl-5-hydroxy-6-metoxy-1,4-benzoquinol methylase